MAFQKPTVSKISTDIKDLTIYIRTLKKFGKSTLFRDTILEKYGDAARGMLIGLGAEMGYTLLDNLNRTHVETWQELEEIKDWLIDKKGVEHNIEMVAFDVVDEFFPILEKEVIRQANLENPKKPVSSIKAAYGGYNAGVEKAQQMAKDYFLELKKAGIGVWAIAHTKFKNVKQKGDIDDGYQSLSSTLNSNYESVFGDVFDCVLTGFIDRAVEDETIEVGDKEKTIHHATDEIRKLYFRGTTFVDAGCRFADGSVPEFLVFDQPNMAKNFIHTLEEGMRLSRSGNVSESEFKQIQNEDKKEVKEIVSEPKKADIPVIETLIEDDEAVVDEAKNMELLTEIRSKYKTTTPDNKGKVKAELETIGAKSMNKDLPTKVLQNIVNILNK